MCGITGYIGKDEAAPILIKGLARLEYRGYDSAGIAVLERGRIKTLKMPGKIKELYEGLKKTRLSGAGVTIRKLAISRARRGVTLPTVPLLRGFRGF